jgi:ribokinase
MPRLRLAVIGHVEHVTLGRVAAIPRAGEIAHLEAPRWLPGGGGGVAFWQLARADAEVHLFTAVGRDEAGREVEAALAASGAHVHAARRDEAHPRVVAMIAPDGERTIVVVGDPLQPRRADALPWDVLARCDGAYFTAQDPQTLAEARRARVLVATARRREALARSGAGADVVVGSAADARERSALADYPVPPGALVLTEGAAGGRIFTASGSVHFAAPRAERIAGGGAYGAGDSFAAALTFYLAAGREIADACTRAARHGAAVLRGMDPRDGQIPLTLH